jgi:hypothetical protein
VTVFRFALQRRAQLCLFINIANKASEGFFQRVILVSSTLSKYVTYANFTVLSLSAKEPAQLILLHIFLYFKQSLEKAELAQ